MAAFNCDTDTSYYTRTAADISTSTTISAYRFKNDERYECTITCTNINPRESPDEEIQKAILATLARLRELSTWQVPYKVIPQKKLYTSRRIFTTHKHGRSRSWTGKNFCKCSY